MSAQPLKSRPNSKSKSIIWGSKLDQGFDISDKFKVIKRYVKKADDLDSQLAGVSIADGLTLNSTTIFSCIESNREALVVRYSWNFENIMAGQVDGVVRLFNANTMKTESEITDPDVAGKTPCTGIKSRPLGKDNSGSPNITCTYANGFVKCWNTATKDCVYTINENRQVLSLAYHPRYPKIITCGDDSKILMYDEQTKTLERVFQSSNSPGEIDGHVSRVFAVKFNPTSNFEFVSGGWDDVICFWDIRQPSAIRFLSGPHICGSSIDVNTEGTELLTCAWSTENQISIWEYATGKLLKAQNAQLTENAKLYCGKYVSPRYIASGGYNPNLFKIVDPAISTVAQITGLKGAVYSMDIGDPKRKRNERIKTPLLEVPRLVMAAGKRIYQCDFA